MPQIAYNCRPSRRRGWQICDLRDSLLTPLVHILIFSTRLVRYALYAPCEEKEIETLRCIARASHDVISWRCVRERQIDLTRKTSDGARSALMEIKMIYILKRADSGEGSSTGAECTRYIIHYNQFNLLFKSNSVSLACNSKDNAFVKVWSIYCLEPIQLIFTRFLATSRVKKKSG